MTEIRVNNPVQDEFAMVPNVLWRWPGLSFKAKGFLAYLLSFRHGICPPVATMEAETGLGRDARKAVMRELEAVKLARWVVQRNSAGRVVAKYLEVTTLPLLAAVVAEASQENVHTPENPSDGKSGAARRETRRCATGNQAILKRKKEDKSARAAVAREAAARSAPASRAPNARPMVGGKGLASVSDLSPLQRSYLRANRDMPNNGLPSLKPGQPHYEQLRQAVLAQDAMREVA